MSDDQLQEKIDAAVASALDGVEARLSNSLGTRARRGAKLALEEILGLDPRKMDKRIRETVTDRLAKRWTEHPEEFNALVQEAVNKAIQQRFVGQMAAAVNNYIAQFDTHLARDAIRSALHEEVKRIATEFVTETLNVKVQMKPFTGRKLISP